MFIRDTGIQFSVLMVSLPDFSTWLWWSQKSCTMFFPLLYFKPLSRNYIISSLNIRMNLPLKLNRSFVFFGGKVLGFFGFLLFVCSGSQLRQVGSLVAAGGLLSCGLWAPQLWHANSQLRHACGIQFPDQGSNPGLLHWEHGVLSTAPPGKSPGGRF